MRILSAELHDYLSFRDCPPIEFREGINLVVGMNNSGKSALLKALNPNLPAQANRSDERFRDSELPPPRVTLTIRTTGARLQEAALEHGGEIHVPLPGYATEHPQVVEFLSSFFSQKSIEIILQHFGTIKPLYCEYPGHRMFDAKNWVGAVCTVLRNK